MSKIPKFNIKKKGYDTFAVDAYINQLKQELEFSEAKLNVYRKQLDFLSAQLEIKQDQSLQLINEIKFLQASVDKMILPEEIENYMHKNDTTAAHLLADEIILEALLIAKDVLDNLAVTASNTKEYKHDLVVKLNEVLQSVSDLEIIEPLNFDFNLK